MNLARIFPLLISSIVACSSGPDEESPEVGEAQRHQLGLFVWVHDADEPGVSFSGQLVDYQALTRAQVLHALAVPELAWLVEAPGDEVEGCELVQAQAPSLPGVVDLLSVGEITLRPPQGEALLLKPRDFPGVVFSISGVVYDADAPDGLPYLAERPYLFEASMGLRGQVSAPRPIRLASALSTAEGLSVAWTGASGARVLLLREDALGTIGVRCWLEEGQALTIPSELLMALGPGEARLQLARTAHAAVDGGLGGDVVLLFVTRDSADLVLPEPPELAPSERGP